MVLVHYLLLLFLLAMQPQNAQNAPIAGQGAAEARRSALAALEPEPDSMLIPSWYLKRKGYDKFPQEFPEVFPEGPTEYLTAKEEAPFETDPETLPETFAIGEGDSVPDLHEETIEHPMHDIDTFDYPEKHLESAIEQKAKAAEHWELSKNYILGTAAGAALLLLGVVSGFIIMYQLLKRDMWTQGDTEAEGEAELETVQANKIKERCCLFPEVFEAELAQLYKNMSADPSPLPTCPFCALADGTPSRDHWISLDSPQPAPSWCPCYQYQQGYFTFLEDDDYFSDSI